MENSLPIVEIKHIFSNMKQLPSKVDDKTSERWAGPGAEMAMLSGGKWSGYQWPVSGTHPGARIVSCLC